jgi:hypothetical protein
MLENIMTVETQTYKYSYSQTNNTTIFLMSHNNTKIEIDIPNENTTNISIFDKLHKTTFAVGKNNTLTVYSPEQKCSFSVKNGVMESSIWIDRVPAANNLRKLMDVLWVCTN